MTDLQTASTLDTTAAPETPGPEVPTQEAESTASTKKTDVPSARAITRATTPDKGGFFWGTGRRKAAVARVRIRPGQGKFIINKREKDEYFNELRDRNDIQEPLKVTDTQGKIDIFVNLHGGGFMGQAGAVRLGLARALKNYDQTLEEVLRKENMLSRDPRRVERKKYGQPGARKRFQFSKR